MTLSDEKWVRIMCDYSADGIWAMDGCACDPEELPVSGDLRDRLLKWQDWYESGPCDGSPWPDIEAFSAEGEAIARAVKSALPGWTVVYYHEAKAGAALDGVALADIRATPRDSFEYEVE